MRLTTEQALAQFPRLWEITKKCFSSVELPSYFIFKVALSKGDTWVVYNGAEEIVGYALVMPHRYGPNKPLLQSIAILPEWRCNGFARFMLSEIEHEYRGVAEKIILHCKPDNHNAVLLYGRVGYAVTKRIKDYYWPEGDGLEMEKIL